MCKQTSMAHDASNLKLRCLPLAQNMETPRQSLAKLGGIWRKKTTVHNIDANDSLAQNGSNGFLGVRVDTCVSNGLIKSIKPRKSSIGRTEGEKHNVIRRKSKDRR